MRWLIKAVFLWILGSRRTDALRSGDGLRWILRPSRAYWGLYLFCGLLFLGAGATALGVSLVSRNLKARGDARLGAYVFIPVGAIGIGYALRLKGRRLILDDGGIEDVLSGARIPWEAIVAFRLGYNGEFKIMSEKQAIKTDLFMDGLGRLKDEIIRRVPRLIVPVGNRWTAMHPFEGFPTLRKGLPDASLRRPEESEATFTLGVDKVYPIVAVPWLPARTGLKGAVLKGTLHRGDWVAPREGSDDRTWILVIRTFVSAKAEAAEGDKVELEIYGSGWEWIKPGVLIGGPPP